MPDEQCDVVAVLTHDHRELEDLFARIEAPGGDAQTTIDLVAQVTVEFVRHSVAEERWLYPAVRETVPDGASLAGRVISGHAAAEQLLQELECLQPGDADYATTLTASVAALIADVRHHVHREETELFPKLVAASTPEQLGELGAKIK